MWSSFNVEKNTVGASKQCVDCQQDCRLFVQLLIILLHFLPVITCGWCLLHFSLNMNTQLPLGCRHVCLLGDATLNKKKYCGSKKTVCVLTYFIYFFAREGPWGLEVMTMTLHLLSVISLSLQVKGGMCVRGQGLHTDKLNVKETSAVCFSFSLSSKCLFQMMFSPLKCALNAGANMDLKWTQGARFGGEVSLWIRGQHFWSLEDLCALSNCWTRSSDSCQYQSRRARMPGNGGISALL